MTQRWTTFFAAVVLVAATAVAGSAQQIPSNVPPVSDSDQLIEERFIELTGHVVRLVLVSPQAGVVPENLEPQTTIAGTGFFDLALSARNWGHRLEIWNESELVYSYTGWLMNITSHVAVDITGDGNLNLVVEEHSMGRMGSYEYHVFEWNTEASSASVRPGFDLLFTSGPMANAAASFEDLDGDGVLEMLGRDDGYGYWPNGWPTRPMPSVVRRWNGSGYEVAMDLMTIPLSELDGQNQIAQKINTFMRTDEPVCVPRELYEIVIGLIYAGHWSSAWQFFDDAWPDGTVARACDSVGVRDAVEFRDELLLNVTESTYGVAVLAEHGDPEAQFLLGNTYATGSSLGQGMSVYNLGVGDDVAAARWYRESAEQGYWRAQSELGRHYLTGRGVPQDYVLAYKSFNLAASRRSGQVRERAIADRDSVYELLTRDQIAEAQRLAREWDEAHPRD